MADLTFQSTSLAVPDPGLVRVQFGEHKLQICVSDLTVKTIAKIFHLLPDTVLLVSEEGTVAVPDDSGRFQVDDFLQWRVQGDVSSVGTSGSRFSTNQQQSNPGVSNSTSTSVGMKWKSKSFAPRA